MLPLQARLPGFQASRPSASPTGAAHVQQHACCRHAGLAATASVCGARLPAKQPTQRTMTPQSTTCGCASTTVWRQLQQSLVVDQTISSPTTAFCLLGRSARVLLSLTATGGDLVFTNMTTKKFIVIETDTFGSIPPAELQQSANRAGQRLFNLLTYVGYDPTWVRCGIWSDRRPRHKPRLQSGLLLQDSAEAAAAAAAGNDGDLPRFTEIDASNCQPCLSADILSKIDAIIGRDSSMASSVADKREKAGGLTALRAKVLLGSSSSSNGSSPAATKRDVSAPAATAAANPEHECANCHKTAEEAGVERLLRCSACKLAWYCNASCQSSQWKAHKAFCKQHRH